MIENKYKEFEEFMTQRVYKDRENRAGVPAKKTVVKIALIAGISLVLIFFVLFFFFFAFIHARPETNVPYITGKHVSEALDLLEGHNLSMLKAGSELAPDMPADSIVRQLPPAGTTVREGKAIRVWLSRVSENISVPDLSGQSLADAELTLSRAYLAVGKRNVAYSLTADKGSVISQDPAPSTFLAKGSEVNLTVSNGKPPSSLVLMPDFRQKKIADFNLWASQNNMETEIVEDSKSAFPGGMIIGQSVDAGAEVNPAEKIVVTVSAKPHGDYEKLHKIHYELPQGKANVRVKITVLDALGEREVLHEYKRPGSKIDLTIPYEDSATVRVYADGILVRSTEAK